MHASALTKRYGRRSVLDDVTFHVDRICPGIRLSTAQTLISDVALANDVLEVHGVIGGRPPAALRFAVSVVRKGQASPAVGRRRDGHVLPATAHSRGRLTLYYLARASAV